MDITVNNTVQADLCCGCGICKGICPKGCISWGRKNGLYIPQINTHQCVSCGLCAAVCPGLGHRYDTAATAEETITGPVLASYNAWSLNAELRHVSASGGVVSTIIQHLLEKGCYDGAFCLDSYDYRQQLKTRLYTVEEVTACFHGSNAPKSRYLPVSHENAVAYMKQNRHARLILVATSCCIRGLQAAVEKLKLDREQYLFIGLFCDKVFNYNVLSYWQDQYCGGNTLTALHFKNKESGGWPGDMKFFPAGQEPFYVPLNDRAKAKAYFMPERCLYCVDKLNICADISLGDNYTGKDDSPLGSNSVILRTARGMRAWKAAEDQLESHPVTIADIQQAQYLQGRLNNLYFGQLRTHKIPEKPDLNCGVPIERNPREFDHAWHSSLKKLRTGAQYHTEPKKLIRQMHNDTKDAPFLIRFLQRGFYFLKRKITR